MVHFAKSLGGTLWYGGGVMCVCLCVCVGAEVISAAAARDWSCSQSCTQTAINALAGMLSNVRGLHLGQ